MSAKLGVNIGADADPAAVAATGAAWVRCVWRDWMTSTWLQAFTSRGVEVVLVGDSSPDSLGDDERRWAGRMTVARSNLGHLVKWWQWGNEPDGTGIASWTMDKNRVNRLLATARGVFPADGAWTLVGPGLVSGDTNWPNGVDTHLVDALDAHLYAQFIDNERARGNLAGIIDRYLAYGKPLWIAEYDSRTPGLSAYFRDYAGVERAAVFCWDSKQTEGEGITGMGIKDNRQAMASFKAATAGPISPPENRPHYQLGFAQFAAAEPTLVGQPLEDERGGIPDFSQQRTSRGILTAAKLEGQGWKLLFWDQEGGGRYVFDGSRAVRIA